MSGVPQEVAVGIIGAVVVAVLSVGGTRFFTHVQRLRTLGHVSALVGRSDCIKIVFPCFEFGVLGGSTDFGKQPGNVALMPMAEGAAIARMVVGLRKVKRDLDIRIESWEDFRDDGVTPFVSIGGPSVNGVTDSLIEANLKGGARTFHLPYPEHVARYGTTHYSPHKDEKGWLTEDYGFILAGRTKNGTRFASVWGVYAPGTLIAARAYLEEVKRRGDARRSLRQGRQTFMVAQGDVEGYVVHNIHMTTAHAL